MIKVRPLRLAIPIQVGVYMFNSEMIAVGKSPVKSERATSCVSSQRASEGKRSCNDCSDRRPMRRLIGMTQMMVKAQMIPFSSVWRRMSDERDTNTIRCQCKSRFSGAILARSSNTLPRRRRRRRVHPKSARARRASDAREKVTNAVEAGSISSARARWSSIREKRRLCLVKW